VREHRRRCAPAVLPPGERNNSHPVPAVSVDQLLAEINLDLAPPKAPVNRGLPGVGSTAPLMPNNSRPGPAQPISAPAKRRPAPSQRPVPPSVSGPIGTTDTAGPRCCWDMACTRTRCSRCCAT
jgi:hypothetical protein